MPKHAVNSTIKLTLIFKITRMNEEERRKIYLNNLSKIKNRTGRPKKSGKRIYFRCDLMMQMILDQLAEKNNMTMDEAINESILLFLLKNKVISKNFQYSISTIK